MPGALSTEALRMALDEHDILLKFTDGVARLFDRGATAELGKAVEAMSLLFRKTIPEHFTFEEENIFQPLLAGEPGPENYRLATDLTAEHKVLLAQMEQLQQILAQPDAVCRQEKALWAALMDFLKPLEKHAEQEDQLFHSLLGAGSLLGNQKPRQ